MTAQTLHESDVAAPCPKSRPYPAHRPSRMWGVPVIPEHWKEKPLKSVAAINTDKLSESTDPDYEIEYVDIGNVSLEMGITSTEKYRFENAPSRARRRVRNGDTIISTVRTYLKAVAQVVTPPENLIVSTGFAVLRAKPALDPGFLYRLAQSEPLVERIMAHSVGVSYPAINASEIGRFAIPVPPLDEQRAIAAFLDCETARIDELIAKKQRLIELLEIKRKAIAERVVTRGLAPNVSMKKVDVGWLENVPSHWTVFRIANVYRDVADQGNEELPILSVSIHSGISDEQIADEDMDRKVLRSEDKSKYLRVLPGDLVYNMMRAWQGAFGAARVEGMVSPAYVVARPKTQVSTQFIEHLLRTPNAVEEMRRNSYGVADFRLRLYWDQFKNIRVVLPPLEEANAICNYIDGVSRSVNQITDVTVKTIAALRHLRSALITSAVTGQIDLRNYQKEAACP